eukprot:12936288-Prorocentrum_lima.AAC.1
MKQSEGFKHTRIAEIFSEKSGSEKTCPQRRPRDLRGKPKHVRKRCAGNVPEICASEPPGPGRPSVLRETEEPAKSKSRFYF